MSVFEKNAESFPHRTMVLFFLVEISSSIDGEKIGSLNVNIQELILYITDASADNTDAQTKIAILEYSTNVEWIYPSPIETENFQWFDLQAGGSSNLGETCVELNKKLSHSHGFMNEDGGMFVPIIILFSGSDPTDDYKQGLEQLKNNNLFKASIKIAIAIGDDANRNVLAEFTGTEEAVLTVHNKERLKQIISYIPINCGLRDDSVYSDLRINLTIHTTKCKLIIIPIG